MNVRELRQVLDALIAASPASLDAEVRIGDQVESGPYLHAPVASVAQGAQGTVILTANDDAQWHDEVGGAYIDLANMPELPMLWKAP